MTRFDAYEMTLDIAGDGRVPQQLALSLNAAQVPVKAKQGYIFGWELVRGSEVLAVVWQSSAQRRDEVHVVTMGTACDEVVPLLRRLWPAHRVSRADSAQDFDGGYDALRTLGLAFGTERALKLLEYESFGDGNTLIVGSRKSEVYVRIYDKSAELRQKFPETASEVPDGLVRVELQARPNKRETKERVSMLTSDELWGLAQWTQDFASELLNVDVDRVATHYRRPPSIERALHFLGAQYGPSLRKYADEVGQEEALRALAEALGLETASFGLGAREAV